MRLSEFELVETTHDGERYGNGSKTFIATITVTKGFLFFKKVTRVKVFKHYLNVDWRFLEGGKHTPGFQCENLARAYAAQNGLSL